MEIVGEVVEKETCVLEEREICGVVGEKGSDVSAQEMENVFSLEMDPCVASLEKVYGFVSS